MTDSGEREAARRRRREAAPALRPSLSPSGPAPDRFRVATWIDHTERGADRPSDHAALIGDFHPAAP